VSAGDDCSRRWSDRSDREGKDREKALRDREVREKQAPKEKPKRKDRPLFEGADDPLPGYERD